MQSLLFKARNLKIFRKYIQTITNYRTQLTHKICQPVSSTVLSTKLDSVVYFQQSGAQRQERKDTNDDWKRESGSNQDKNDDEETKRREELGKRIGVLSIMFAFFYLNLTYLQQVEEMRKKYEAKDQELENERKQNKTKAGTRQEAGPGQSQTVSTKSNNPERVKSTLISWTEFVNNYLSKDNVLELVANRKSELVMIKLKTPVEFAGRNIEFLFMQVPAEILEEKLDETQNELNLERRVYITYKDNQLTQNLLSFALAAGVFFVLFRFSRAAMNKMQSMQGDMMKGMTDKRFQVVDPHLKSGAPKVTFKDVAGLHEAKIEIKEFVDFLREPERFKKLGAKVPKGALLTGPPGCGKTLLAKAVASEANVPFFNVAGTEFIEMVGGVGASRVRTLFEEARKQSPSIIFIDEIDAIGRKRSDANQGSGGSGEFDQTLNQLLVSMDGLESSTQVVVLASTNRADILDKALLRPGRLDRMIDIDLPTYIERIEMLNVHLRGLKINFFGKDRDDFLSQLSHLTPGFSGADLANICNEAALMAARDGHEEINKKQFYAALERVIAGAEKKNSIISVEDKKLIAYREAGKVLVSWYHEYSDLILKVSLISRTKLNAYSQFLPSDKKLYSKDELYDQLCLHFGGRAAETIVFNKTTTNSEEDLKRVTNMAYTQVESLGMSDVIGHLSFPTRAEEKRSGIVGRKPYSKKLRNTIDLEVNKLIASAHNTTVATLNSHIDQLHLLAEELLKKETLSYHEITQIIGEPVNKERYKTSQDASE